MSYKTESQNCMTFLKYIALLSVLTSTAFANVSVYFNHNEKVTYTDPYRGISRQGDNLEEVILAEIRKAKKSIFLAVQELRLPLVAKALIQKHKEGVDVRIVLEDSYNFNVLQQRDVAEGEYEGSRLSELFAFVDLNRNGIIEKHELETRDAMFMLQQSKVPLIDDTSNGSKGSGLMHHKFMVVDGKTTIVSTANFTLSCVHGDYLAPATRGNDNSMVVVGSVEFAKVFLEEFSQLWGNGKRGNFGQGKTYRGPQTVTVRGTKITIQFSPTSQRYNWEESVNGLIASHLSKANRSIQAALFVFSDQKLSEVMQSRQNAGAQVGVMMEPKFAYRDYSELLTLMGVGLLNGKCAYKPGSSPWKVPAKEVGVSNRPNGDVLHHKFAVVDKKSVIVGSQNWSSAANYINDETLIVIQNEKVAEQYAQEYERIKKLSTLGTPKWLLDAIKKQEVFCRDNGRYY